MKILDPLKSLLQLGATVYLITHGVSLPSDAHRELHELGCALYYSSLAWVLSTAAPLRHVVLGLTSFIR